MNRGARRKPVFLSDDHALVFDLWLGRMSERFGVEIHAFVLMSNHYHLLLRSVRGNLSRAMQFFGGEYTRLINLKHRWDGHLFRWRFRSQLISEEQHLRTLVPYIHLNPCRAGLVVLPQEYIWSSHGAYAGLSTPHPWLTRKRVLGLFGSREELLRVTESLRTLKTPWDPGLDPTTGFFEGRTFRCDEDKEAIPGPCISADEVLLLAQKVTSLDREALLEAGKGRLANPGRRLVIWALRRHAGLPHRSIGMVLGLRPPAVSQVLARLRHGPGPAIPEELKRWMASFDEVVRNR